MSKSQAKFCPECGREFLGNGWDGIDAHWRARHEAVMPYTKAWPLIRAGTYRTMQLDVPARLARLEALIRDLGLDPLRDDLQSVLRPVDELAGSTSSINHSKPAGPATDVVKQMDAAIEAHRGKRR